MKYMSIVLATMLTSLAFAEPKKQLPFIDEEFGSFLERIVPSPVRSQFSRRYQDFQDHSKDMAQADRTKRAYELHQRALNALEQDHSAWARDITAFLQDLRFLDKTYDAERVVVREFLERYGLFKEFAKDSLVHLDKTSRTKKAWRTVKTQVAQAAHKVGDWFKGLKSNPIA